MARMILLVLGFGALAPAAGVAAAPCAGVDTALTEAREAASAPLVAQSVSAEVAAKDVSVGHYFAEGAWFVIGAEIPVADGEGYFFFERAGGAARLHDVWGGYADPSEAGALADWARALGAPDALARCFADVVTR